MAEKKKAKLTASKYDYIRVQFDNGDWIDIYPHNKGEKVRNRGVCEENALEFLAYDTLCARFQASNHVELFLNE